jgi:nicotinate dehydrogenase subunit A
LARQSGSIAFCRKSHDGGRQAASVQTRNSLRSLNVDQYSQEARQNGMSGQLTLNINGKDHEVDVPSTMSLLDVLRNHLGLKGSRYGCGLEQCGACMVLLDGEATYSCSREVATVVGRSITTVEGLASAAAMHPLQQAFLDEQAGQCGYCLSGILMASKALLDRTPDPTRAEVAAALDANLCRCGSHPRILRAVLRAAATMRGGVI